MQTSVAAGPAPNHSRAFRVRRFFNWFPLGLTYAFFYMGRYNLAVAGGELSKKYHWNNAEFGAVITAGMWAYAAAFLINGPLTDRLGGKRAMIFGGLGLALANFGMSLLVGMGPSNHVHLAWSALFVGCMYFQSFGATALIKVNSSWFHVSERGTFSGIFGCLIALGYQLAYGVGGIILAQMGLAYVFLVPAISVVVMSLVNVLILKDRPEEAGYPRLSVGDADDGAADDEKVPFGTLLKRMFSNRIIIVLACAEFCTGFVRNGIMFWLPKLVKGAFKVDAVDKIKHLSMLNPAHWDAVTSYGVGLFLTGVVGGILAGRLSDRLFQSRRGPVATIYYFGLCVALVVLAIKHDTAVSVVVAGLAASFFFIGIHGLLSGTASMDFGGRKSAGTATGIIDGFVYLGSGLAGLPLGYLLDKFGSDKLAYWPLTLLPIAILGAVLTATLWNAHPTRKSAADAAVPAGKLVAAPVLAVPLIDLAPKSDRPRPQA